MNIFKTVYLTYIFIITASNITVEFGNGTTPNIQTILATPMPITLVINFDKALGNSIPHCKGVITKWIDDFITQSTDKNITYESITLNGLGSVYNVSNDKTLKKCTDTVYNHLAIGVIINQ